jgi:hypothetical protein
MGFSHYVIGQLERCGKTFYNADVKVRILSEEFADCSVHVVFRLDFDNSAYVPQIRNAPLTGHVEFSSVSLKVFFKVSTLILYFANLGDQ